MTRIMWLLYLVVIRPITSLREKYKLCGVLKRVESMCGMRSAPPLQIIVPNDVEGVVFDGGGVGVQGGLDPTGVRVTEGELTEPFAQTTKGQLANRRRRRPILKDTTSIRHPSHRRELSFLLSRRRTLKEG